jgi:hypothetical protein
MLSFDTLPTEVKGMIYELVLVSKLPIPICSPSRTKYAKVDEGAVVRTIFGRQAFFFRCRQGDSSHFVTVRENASGSYSFVCADFARVSRVSKQMHTEASSVFFSRNKFLVSNGPHGSSKRANLHGLRSFIRNVSPESLASIREVEVLLSETELSEAEKAEYPTLSLRSTTTFWIQSWGYCHMKHPKDLQNINSALFRHFKGLKMVDMDYFRRTNLGAVPRPPLIAGWTEKTPWLADYCIKPLERAMGILLRHPSIEKLRIRDDAAHMPQRMRIILEGMDSSVEIADLDSENEFRLEEHV